MFHVVKQLKRSTKKSHQKTRICLLLCVCVESDVKTPCLPFDNMSWDNELKRSEKYWTKHTTCLSNIKHLIKYCDVFWLLSLIHVWTVLYKLFIILHNLPCSHFVWCYIRMADFLKGISKDVLYCIPNLASSSSNIAYCTLSQPS